MATSKDWNETHWQSSVLNKAEMRLKSFWVINGEEEIGGGQGSVPTLVLSPLKQRMNEGRGRGIL